MLGAGCLSACVPGTSATRGLLRLPGGVGGGQAGPAHMCTHLGAGLTTSSAQLRDPGRSETDPVFPRRQRAPSSRRLRLARGLLQTSEVGPQLGAGDTTRTRGLRARGQFTLRAPHRPQRPGTRSRTGPWGRPRTRPFPQSRCEEPPDQASPAWPGRHRGHWAGRSCGPRARGHGDSGTGEAHGPRHCPRPPPVHTAVWAGPRRRGHGRRLGAEVRPPRAGKSQLQDSTQRGHPGGAHVAPEPARSRSSLEKGAAPPTSPAGWGPPPGHACPSCPSSWPGWGSERAATACSQEGARGGSPNRNKQQETKPPPPARTPGTP